MIDHNSPLTDAEIECHVCCMKRRLCNDDHFHQRGVERILAARIAEARDFAFAEGNVAGYKRGLAEGEARVRARVLRSYDHAYDIGDDDYESGYRHRERQVRAVLAEPTEETPDE